MAEADPSATLPDSRVPVALLTGAGSGIGRATAILLAARGHRLVLVGRNERRLAETIGVLPGGVEAFAVAADVGDAAGVGRAIEAAMERFGRLDVLVNNAGVAPLKPIDGLAPKELERVYRVNALGPAFAIARAWPVFQRQGSAPGPDGVKRGGCIVNVSTMGTIDPFPGFFAYASSKAAVNLMATSCAKEGAAFGIRAFAVAPGAVETAMLRALFSEETLPREKCLSPEEVARVIVGCIEGEYDDRNGGVIEVVRG